MQCKEKKTKRQNSNELQHPNELCKTQPNSSSDCSIECHSKGDATQVMSIIHVNQKNNEGILSSVFIIFWHCNWPFLNYDFK